MSHTVTIDVKVKNTDVFAQAVEAAGGKILGQGTHRLFSTQNTGFGIQMPGWSYPIVVETDGSLKFDDYHGRWGDVTQLHKLTDDYAQLVVKNECDNLGWYTEKNDQGELVVHHPEGGIIIVQKGGSLDAQGFHGKSCADATLKLEQALGTRLGESIKPEMNETQLQVRESE